MGKAKFITAINIGGASKGIAISFTGKYVESGEIEFKDVQLEYGFADRERKIIPLTLEKVQAKNGNWIYSAKVPDFQIPEKIKEGLPYKKASEEKSKKEFAIRFTPVGNPRKSLDICVYFIPIENLQGLCNWCVWHLSDSKREYINQFNKGKDKISEAFKKMGFFNNVLILDPNDFDDLDD